MIKANAYGHGLFEVANSLEKADMLGMACCSEAYTLRENKVMQDIILMQGVSYLDELEYCFNNNCQIVINTKYHVELINRFSKKLDSKSNKKLIICQLQNYYFTTDRQFENLKCFVIGPCLF